MNNNANDHSSINHNGGSLNNYYYEEERSYEYEESDTGFTLVTTYENRVRDCEDARERFLGHVCTSSQVCVYWSFPREMNSIWPRSTIVIRFLILDAFGY